MKTSALEKQFYNSFEIPIDYPMQLSNLKYLQLASIVFNFKNVKELRQEILKRCIDNKESITDCIRQIFYY